MAQANNNSEVVGGGGVPQLATPSHFIAQVWFLTPAALEPPVPYTLSNTETPVSSTAGSDKALSAVGTGTAPLSASNSDANGATAEQLQCRRDSVGSALTVAASSTPAGRHSAPLLELPGVVLRVPSSATVRQFLDLALSKVTDEAETVADLSLPGSTVRRGNEAQVRLAVFNPPSPFLEDYTLHLARPDGRGLRPPPGASAGGGAAGSAQAAQAIARQRANGRPWLEGFATETLGPLPLNLPPSPFAVTGQVLLHNPSVGFPYQFVVACNGVDVSSMTAASLNSVRATYVRGGSGEELDPAVALLQRGRTLLPGLNALRSSAAARADRIAKALLTAHQRGQAAPESRHRRPSRDAHRPAAQGGQSTTAANAAAARMSVTRTGPLADLYVADDEAMFAALELSPLDVLRHGEGKDARTAAATCLAVGELLGAAEIARRRCAANETVSRRRAADDVARAAASREAVTGLLEEQREAAARAAADRNPSPAAQRQKGMEAARRQAEYDIAAAARAHAVGASDASLRQTEQTEQRHTREDAELGAMSAALATTVGDGRQRRGGPSALLSSTTATSRAAGPALRAAAQHRLHHQQQRVAAEERAQQARVVGTTAENNTGRDDTPTRATAPLPSDEALRRSAIGAQVEASVAEAVRRRVQRTSTTTVSSRPSIVVEAGNAAFPGSLSLAASPSAINGAAVASGGGGGRRGPMLAALQLRSVAAGGVEQQGSSSACSASPAAQCTTIGTAPPVVGSEGRQAVMLGALERDLDAAVFKNKVATLESAAGARSLRADRESAEQQTDLVKRAEARRAAARKAAREAQDTERARLDVIRRGVGSLHP